MFDQAIHITLFIGYSIFAIGLFQHLVEFVQTIVAFVVIAKEKTNSNERYDIIQSDYKVVPKISIFVPAYNEEVTISENIYNLAAINYPCHEVIVINDGSKDSTLQVLKKNLS